MKKITKLIAFLMAAVLLLSLCACAKEEEKSSEKPSEKATEKPSEKPTEKPTTNQPSPEPTKLAGKYWLYSMYDGNEEVDYEMLVEFGMAQESYLLLKEDGTGELAFTGEDPDSVTYDASSMTITAASGESVSFTMDGDKLTISYDEEGEAYTMTFVLEGSALHDEMLAYEPETPAIDSADLMGRYECVGIGEAPDNYSQPDELIYLYIYEEQLATLEFEDLVRDFTWVYADDVFQGIGGLDDTVIMDGTVENGFLEVLYENGYYYLFEKMTDYSEEYPDVEPPEEDTITLEWLRWVMEDSPTLFAYSYLGRVDGPTGDGIMAWLEETNPEILEEVPCILETPYEQIAGSGLGELYYIVPRDETATVSVNLLQEDYQGEPEIAEILYRSESGDPVIISCNSGGFFPDVQVVIVGADGETVVWYPYVAQDGYVYGPVDENEMPLSWDFTNYD